MLGRASAEAGPPSWRFLDLSYGTGVQQVALTEALLQSVAAGARPVLRIYSWSEPTVFIGVGEPAADVDRARCSALGIPIVRRLSGGAAVLHNEHWVSVEAIAPVGVPLVPSDVLGAYQAFANAIGAGLARLGIAARPLSAEEARRVPAEPSLAAACFAGLAPFEIMSRGRKLAGLAQVRKRGAAVVHAAIGLRFDVPALVAVLTGAGELSCARLEARVTDLERESHRWIPADELAAALRGAFVDALGDALAADVPSTDERRAAAHLAVAKYADPDWTYRR